MLRITLFIGFVTLSGLSLFAQESSQLANISAARRDDDGLLVHDIESTFQAGKTQIRVLLPTELAEGQCYPVVYVLPVEAGRESHFGDGLKEIKKQRLHDKYHAIFAAPTFAQLPWYADHPTDPTVQQESYFVRDVVFLVEQHYPAQKVAGGRLLLGFSKSGWGAWSLLLRHPHIFGRAAAWDAPLMLDRPGKYGSGPIFGDAENFENYRISSLLREKAATFSKTERLILTGYGNFRQEHQGVHQLLNELKIPHAYRDGPRCPHDWHSGWVSEAVELLLDQPNDEP